MTRPPHGDKRMDIFQRCFLDLDLSDGLYEVLSTSYRHYYMSPGQLVLGCIGGVDYNLVHLLSLEKSICFEGFAPAWPSCLAPIISKWKPAYLFEFLYLLCVISLPFGLFWLVTFSTLLDITWLFNLETRVLIRCFT